MINQAHTRWRRLAPIALLLFMATVLVASTHDIWNADLGFHLAGGRQIQLTGSVPATDDFSYTARGLPWRNFEWLYQWVTYRCWQAMGPAGVILEHTVFNLLTFGLLAWALFRRKGIYPLGLAMLLLALLVCEIRFSIRPHAAGRVFVVVLLMVLLAYRRNPAAVLWPLLFFQLVWCNVHGTYVLAVLFTGFLVVDDLLEKRPVRRPVLLLIGLVLASMVTPYGWKQTAALFTHRSLVAGRAANPEWMPISLTLPVLTDPGVIAWFILAAVTGYLLWIRPVKRLGWFEGGTWLMGLFGPFLHVRALPLSAIVFCMLASTVQPTLSEGEESGQKIPAISWAGVTCVLLAVLVAFASNWYWTTFKRYARLGLGVSPITLGWGSGQKLVELNETGDVFNSYATGGWLAWWLYPHGGRVFIDGRDVGNVYTPEIQGEYLAILEDPAVFETARRKYLWNAVVLERNNTLCHGLIAYLNAQRGWTKVYADDESLVFLPRLIFDRAER